MDKNVGKIQFTDITIHEMVWDPMSHRATVDIDLLAKTSNSIANLQKIINEVCTIEVIPDGLKFVSETLRLSEAQLQAEYHGISAAFSESCILRLDQYRRGFGRCDYFEYVQRVSGRGDFRNRLLIEVGTASGKEPTDSTLGFFCLGFLQSFRLHILTC